MSYYPSDEDKSSIILAAMIVALALAILALVGCGEARPPAAPVTPPSVADQLRELGASFLTWGGISLGLGLVFRLIVFAAGFLTLVGPFGAAIAWVAKAVAPFVGLTAIGGLAALSTGAAFTWLADYLWAVVLACFLTAVAGAVYYWPRIRVWIPSRSPPDKVI